MMTPCFLMLMFISKKSYIMSVMFRGYDDESSLVTG